MTAKHPAIYAKSTLTLQKFWAKVAAIGEGCWEWGGARTHGGYGLFCFDAKGKHTSAHRYAYELHTAEEIPEEMVLCHTCDNRLCVNPSHMFVGTVRDNVLDMIGKRRHPFLLGDRCKFGHLFTKENTVVRKNGARRCRECVNAYQRAQYKKDPQRHLAYARKAYNQRKEAA